MSEFDFALKAINKLVEAKSKRIKELEERIENLLNTIDKLTSPVEFGPKQEADKAKT